MKLLQRTKKVGFLMMLAAIAMAISASAAFASPPSVVPDFSGVDVGFSPANLLSGATGFYTLFVGFIVLVLSVKFAPSMIGFLFTIIGKARSSK